MPKIIGCIHLPPLPGAPKYNFNKKEIIRRATEDLHLYLEAGVDGVIVENTSDIPYLKGFVYPETVSLLSIICYEIKKFCESEGLNIELGLQVLSGANIEALGIAYNCDFNFIRVEGYSFAHVADEGIIESCAAELMRKRACLEANNIKIIADIKKKHSSHSITDDLSVRELAKLTEYMEPDGLVLTGHHTGEPPEPEVVKEVKDSTSLPVYIGSGIKKENFMLYSNYADYFIVGSYFKYESDWNNSIDTKKLNDFMRAIKHQKER